MEEQQEKNDIQDAQISETTENDNKPKNKKSYQTEIILIFIIGLLLGIMLKAESLKKVSIGFSDYRVAGGVQEYKMDDIEKQLKEKSEKAQAEQAEQQQAQPTQPATGNGETVPAE